jgi:aspartyl-tRNA(Asn)/glutamyl-tRNA(Gln) amidotransferase subunit A
VEATFLSVSQIGKLIAQRKVSPVEVLRSLLERIDRLDKSINAYITLTADKADQAALQAEKEILGGHYRGPFHGVPVAIKDIVKTKGVRTTCGSKVLAENVPEDDATIVESLKQAGAVIVGKLNMHELALGGTTINPHFGPTRNPWDLDRIPGGSSGGSGAAVASSLCFASIGTDGAGSVRIPSALCGIVGLKPTYGRVSRNGAIPFTSWSLDHVGPMTKSVEDSALMLAILSGFDPRDPTTADVPVPDYSQSLTGSVDGLKLGVPREYFTESIDQEVRESFHQAIRVMADFGARVEEVSLPHVSYALAVFWGVSLPEVAGYHGDGIEVRPQDYGADVRDIIRAGRCIPAGDYIRAQRARRVIMADFRQAFQRVDAILTPTVPFPAPTIQGELNPQTSRGLDLIRLTCPFNLTGLPAISVPCGFSAEGLPIGLQIAGRPFDEGLVLRVAHAYEQNTPWHKSHPNVD